MTVFKGYLRIIRRNLASTISYIVVFFGITIAINSLQSDQQEKFFKESSVDIAVVDEDKSELSKSLITFLKKGNSVSEDETDRAKLSRELYYRDVEYVLVIPKGFSEDFSAGKESLESSKAADSAAGFYLDNQLNQYLAQVRLFETSGFSASEAIEKASALSEVKPKVTLRDINGSAEPFPAYGYYLRYLPYLYLGVLILSIGNVLREFSGRELRHRMIIAPVASSRQTVEGMLAFSLFFLGLWVFSMAAFLPLGMKGFYVSTFLPLYLINTLLVLFFAAAAAFLLGNLVHSDAGISAVSNVVSLGMSFLCGVFVPLEFLGDGIKKVSRILPVYWYERINDLLGSTTKLAAGDTAVIRTGLLVQAGWILAILIAAILLGVSRRVER